jgi:hypothetical protein
VKKQTATKQQQPTALTSDELASVSGGGWRGWSKRPPRPRSPRGNRPR